MIQLLHVYMFFLNTFLVLQLLSPSRSNQVQCIVFSSNEPTMRKKWFPGLDPFPIVLGFTVGFVVCFVVGLLCQDVFVPLLKIIS